MVKYMINNWLATKITFCNEMAAICDSMDIHWPRVREAWLGDNRVGRSHTTVDNGYGGKCLPKDLAAMIAAARSHGYVPELLEQVRASNDKFGGES
jgi:UDP-glucose 6-dehydrogenase